MQADANESFGVRVGFLRLMGCCLVVLLQRQQASLQLSIREDPLRPRAMELTEKPLGAFRSLRVIFRPQTPTRESASRLPGRNGFVASTS